MMQLISVKEGSLSSVALYEPAKVLLDAAKIITLWTC